MDKYSWLGRERKTPGVVLSIAYCNKASSLLWRSDLPRRASTLAQLATSDADLEGADTAPVDCLATAASPPGHLLQELAWVRNPELVKLNGKRAE